VEFMAVSLLLSVVSQGHTVTNVMAAIGCRSTEYLRVSTVFSFSAAFLCFTSTVQQSSSIVFADSNQSDVFNFFIFKYPLQPFKAYCAIWVRRSNFRPLGVSTHVTTREHLAAEGGTVGEKCPRILPKCRFTRYI